VEERDPPFGILIGAHQDERDRRGVLARPVTGWHLQLALGMDEDHAGAQGRCPPERIGHGAAGVDRVEEGLVSPSNRVPPAVVVASDRHEIRVRGEGLAESGGVCVQSDGPDCATAAGCRSQDDGPAGEVCAIGCCDPTKFLCLSACLVV
jgi:hypothetical protein